MQSVPLLRRSNRPRKPRRREEVISLVERDAMERARIREEEEENAAVTDAEELEELLDAAELPVSSQSGNIEDLAHQSDACMLPPADFPLAAPRRDVLEIFNDCHKIWFIRIILTMVAFLHTRHNVSFRACAILLFTLNAIFLALGCVTLEAQIPINLTTVITRLDLDDRFQVFPLCKKCHRIFKSNIPSDTLCPDCGNALFRTVSHTLFRRLSGRNPPSPPPICSVPMQALSSLLVEFLSRPGMEYAIESYWKTRTCKDGFRADIMDGDIWKTAKGPDGKLFFDPEDTSDELRIGVTMSLDWYDLFIYF